MKNLSTASKVSISLEARSRASKDSVFAVKDQSYTQVDDDGENYYQVKMEAFDEARDGPFIERILVPYLVQVYQGLVARGTKEYLDLQAQKQYLNMPEPLAEAVCRVINANGDERIDMDEFVQFFTTVLVGNP